MIPILLSLLIGICVMVVLYVHPIVLIECLESTKHLMKCYEILNLW